MMYEVNCIKSLLYYFISLSAPAPGVNAGSLKRLKTLDHFHSGSWSGLSIRPEPNYPSVIVFTMKICGQARGAHNNVTLTDTHTYGLTGILH